MLLLAVYIIDDVTIYGAAFLRHMLRFCYAY